MAGEAKLIASIAFWLRMGLTPGEAGDRAAETCGCVGSPAVSDSVELGQAMILAGLLFTESRPSQPWPISMIPVNPYQAAPYEYVVEGTPTTVAGEPGRPILVRVPSADQLPWDEIARIVQNRIKDRIQTSPEGFGWMREAGVTVLPVSGIPIRVVGISRKQ